MKRIRKAGKEGDDESDGDDNKQTPGRTTDDVVKDAVAAVSGGPPFHDKPIKMEEIDDDVLFPRTGVGAVSAADRDQAQTLASLGLSTGSTGLTTAPPGFSALANLQLQLQNAGAAFNSHGNSTMSNVITNGGGDGNQSSFPVTTPALGGLPTNLPPQSATTSALDMAVQLSATTATPGTINSLGGGVGSATLDNSVFLKLQEALQSGSWLAQPPPQQTQTSLPQSTSSTIATTTPTTLNLTNLNFLQGPLGGALAAQLQAATQAPPRNSSNNNEQEGGGGNSSGDATAPQQQQSGADETTLQTATPDDPPSSSSIPPIKSTENGPDS